MISKISSYDPTPPGNKMKQSEISKLNLKDLDAKIIELKKKLFDLKMSSYVSELENPVQIR